MLTPEIIQEKGFNEDQVAYLGEFLPTVTKEIEDRYSKVAAENAEKILKGAADRVFEKTKIQRNQGEKIGDYLERVGGDYLGSLESKQKEYDEKIASIKGNETLGKEFTELKTKFSTLQQKEAQFDELLGAGYKEKYETTATEYENLKKSYAFEAVKPQRPETVNKYEFDAKWTALTNKIISENEIVIKDGKAFAVSKENQHKITELSILVDKDTEIQDLVKGRQQQGIGAKPIDSKKIDGVPFEVPKGADAETRSKVIKDYLIAQGFDFTSVAYSDKFAEYNSKILQSA